MKKFSIILDVACLIIFSIALILQVSMQNWSAVVGWLCADLMTVSLLFKDIE